MKILHIVAGMPPESGMAAVVAGLCRAMSAQGHDVSLATTSEEERGKRKEERKNVEHSTSSFADTATADRLNIERRMEEVGVRVVMFGRSWPGAVYFSWGMLMGLGREVRTADVVHVHGCWTFPVWWGAWLALWYKKTLVMSPHGALDPVRLQHSAWKKRLVGWMDRWLLRRASVVHATCGSEKRWIEAFVGKVAVGSSSGQLGENIEHSTSNVEHPIKKKEENIQYPTRNIQYPMGRRPRIVVIPNGVG